VLLLLAQSSDPTRRGTKYPAVCGHGFQSVALAQGATQFAALHRRQTHWHLSKCPSDKRIVYITVTRTAETPECEAAAAIQSNAIRYKGAFKRHYDETKTIWKEAIRDLNERERGACAAAPWPGPEGRTITVLSFVQCQRLGLVGPRKLRSRQVAIVLHHNPFSVGRLIANWARFVALSTRGCRWPRVGAEYGPRGPRDGRTHS
jgi:hypothetical protein